MKIGFNRKNGLYTGWNSAEKNVNRHNINMCSLPKKGFQPQNAEWVSEQQCFLK